MTEKKTSLKVPEAYLPLLEDISLLKTDENNPNRMSLKQQDQVWRSLQKYGWTYPIITNKDGVFADGEQRAQVCKMHNEFFAPILRLPVSDIDRRMLRQILNKLKGQHSKDLDALEYSLIIEAGQKDDLQALLSSIGEKLPLDFTNESPGSSIVPESYELLIKFRDEQEQQALFTKLQEPEIRRMLDLKDWNAVRVINL